MKNKLYAVVTLELLLIALSFSFVSASLEQRTLGDETAPVKIVMFTDFECPFCSNWHTQTFPLIKENYIDGGEVVLVVRHFPLSFHPNAENAAIAAECASQQDKFFHYIDKLYSNQNNLEEEYLFEYAEQLNLDVERFSECFEDEDTLEIVENDYSKGESKEVTGTPTFFINDQRVNGAQPYSDFEEIIEDILDNGPVVETEPQEQENDFEELNSEEIEILENRVTQLEAELKETKSLLQRLLDAFNSLFE